MKENQKQEETVEENMSLDTIFPSMVSTAVRDMS